MFRILFRVVAALMLAAGFASLVVDGTRSIAGGEFSVTPLFDVVQTRLPGMERAVARNIHPLLWDPVLTALLRLPVWLCLFLGGLLLMGVARTRKGAIDHIPKRGP